MKEVNGTWTSENNDITTKVNPHGERMHKKHKKKVKIFFFLDNASYYVIFNLTTTTANKRDSITLVVRFSYLSAVCDLSSTAQQ